MLGAAASAERDKVSMVQPDVRDRKSFLCVSMYVFDRFSVRSGTRPTVESE